MPVPRLDQQTTDAAGKLVKFSVKADGQNEEAYLYDVELHYPIATEEEAEQVEAYCPGAETAFTNAQELDNWKWSGKTQPATSTKATIARADDGLVLADGLASILYTQIRASKRAVVLVVKLRFGGQTEGVATKLTKNLRAAVGTMFDQPQQELDFGGMAPKLGDIVVGEIEGKSFAGALLAERTRGIEGENQITLDDFGTQFLLTPADVRSFFTIGGDANMAALVRSYETKCKRSKVNPTWRALVIAINVNHPTTDTRGGEYALNIQHVEDAVNLLVDERDNGEISHGAVGMA